MKRALKIFSAIALAAPFALLCVEVLVKFPWNHGGGVGPYVVLGAVALGANVLWMAVERRVGWFRVGALVVLGLALWLCDRLNVVVDYDEWIARGMPDWGEWGTAPKLVYEMQAGATTEEVKRCIGSMDYRGSRLALASRLVVEADGDGAVEDLRNVLHAVGVLGAWGFTLREKGGDRSVKLDLLCADGFFGTIINAEVDGNAIRCDGKELSPEAFRGFARAAVEYAGCPFRIFLVVRGDRIRDVWDAAELLGAKELDEGTECGLRLILWSDWDEKIRGKDLGEILEKWAAGG
jgi:hypothetical protein